MATDKKQRWNFPGLPDGPPAAVVAKLRQTLTRLDQVLAYFFAGTYEGPLTIQGAVTVESALKTDQSSTADDTRLLVWDVTAGALVRVTRGAANSGGAGFRLLRVPN